MHGHTGGHRASANGKLCAHCTFEVNTVQHNTVQYIHHIRSVFLLLLKVNAQLLETSRLSNDGDYFGNAMAFYGTTLVVGAHYSMSSTGAVYVYEKVENGAQSSDWALQVTLLEPDETADEYHYFGSSVAIWGDMIAVGAS